MLMVNYLRESWSSGHEESALANSVLSNRVSDDYLMVVPGGTVFPGRDHMAVGRYPRTLAVHIPKTKLLKLLGCELLPL